MDSDAPATRRIPRGRQRREQLVCVAEKVFLEHGFADSTMQTIATRAGASKETLYRHFASKEALFAEIIGRCSRQISGPESALSSKAPPRRVLFELGCGLLRLITDGEAMPLLRLVIAEVPRTPELGAILYASGPGMTLDRLTEYLRAATERGELHCRRPARAAKLFLGAVIANHRVLALINPPKTPIAEFGNPRPRARRGRDVSGLLRAQIGFRARLPDRPEAGRLRAMGFPGDVDR